MFKRMGWIGVGVVGLALIGVMAVALPQGAAAVQQEGPLGARGALLNCLRDNVAKALTVWKDLNLTPEQKLAIANILKGHRDEIVAAIKNVHGKRRALTSAVRANEVNEQAIRAAAQNLGTAIGDAAVLRAKIRKEVRAVLTPEQLGKVDAVTAEIEQNVDETVAGLGK